MSYQQRPTLAANSFPRRSQFPHGVEAFKIAGIRKLEAKLGRQHRF